MSPADKLMKLEMTMLSELSQIQLEEHRTFALICGIRKESIKVEQRLLLEKRKSPRGREGQGSVGDSHAGWDEIKIYAWVKMSR